MSNDQNPSTHEVCGQCQGSGRELYDLAIDDVPVRTKGSTCGTCLGQGELERDRSDIANEMGFTGTLDQLVEWLEANLVYGHVLRTDVTDDRGRERVRIETVTGGYSSDEHLLARLERSIYVSAAWCSSHRGGLTIYEFPPDWAQEPVPWLEPEESVVQEPVAFAVYGLVTGSLRYVIEDEDEAQELSASYRVVPLVPAV